MPWLLFVFFLFAVAVDSQYDLEYLQKKGKIMISDSVCLRDALRSDHNINRVSPMSSVAETDVLKGVTFYINDFMAVGHIPYVLPLIELIHNPKIQIDRIILQRDPCEREFCRHHSNTWESAFKGFFKSAMAASPSPVANIPIYMRRGKQSPWQPYFLLNVSSEFQNIGSNIPLSKTLCFETLIRPACLRCFNESVSDEGIRAFREMAWSMSGVQVDQQSTKKSKNQLKIALVHRDARQLRSLSPESLTVVLTMVKRAFPKSTVELVWLGLHGNVTKWERQVYLAATTDIMIATHGGFETNLMYMRPNGQSRFVEIRGDYHGARELSASFDQTAKLFRVEREIVSAIKLREHRQPSYQLLPREMKDLLVQVMKPLA